MQRFAKNDVTTLQVVQSAAVCSYEAGGCQAPGV